MRVFVECTAENRALGMEHGQIANDQISASTHYDAGYVPLYGRLNTKFDDNKGCWCPASWDHDSPWFQVDFSTGTTITSVHIQDDPTIDNEYAQIVFTVSYSMDGAVFQNYEKVSCQ